ncbi:MAG: hypothetical protein KJI69_04080 [Patescibacteria group bacterium]|nr:hypothetical protein [Patescibacteria group bacterium]
MAFVIAPILFLIAGLLALGVFNFEEPTYVDLVSEIDVLCYNVNWFGQHGFQIVYQESLIEIAEKLGENNLDFTASTFYEDQGVVDYLVVECPHIDSRLEAPAIFNPSLGVDAYFKCLEQTNPDFDINCEQFN